MKLKDLLTTDEMLWLGRLEEKIKNAKSMDEIEMYKHHMGLIMQQLVYRYKIKYSRKKSPHDG